MVFGNYDTERHKQIVEQALAAFKRQDSKRASQESTTEKQSAEIDRAAAVIANTLELFRC